MKRRHIVKKKYVIFVLIYFCTIISYFSVITLSKYASTIQKVGTITVAKWDVSTDVLDNVDDTLNIIIGNSIENYIIKVTSQSETKVVYSMNLSNLPNDIEVSLDGSEFKESTNNIIEFNDVGTINNNNAEKTNTHVLSFKVPIGSEEIISQEVEINIKFNQVIPIVN